MSEIRLTFRQQLDDIQRDLLRVAARVTETVTRGTQVLLDQDLAGARQLIEDDDEIDLLTIEIEERCFTVLVLQQPVAGDMRAIVTAIRLTSEIERAGDLMVNVAKAARRLYGSDIPPRLRGLLEAMGAEAIRLFRLAMDAYADHDAELAGALDDMDDRLDRLHKDYIQAILELHEDVHNVQMAVQLALVGRYYERIGDHAVNIGERVRYMVTGRMPDPPAVVAAQAAAERAGAAAEGGEPGGEEPDPSEAGRLPQGADGAGGAAGAEPRSG